MIHMYMMHMYYGQDVRVVVTARAVWLRRSVCTPRPHHTLMTRVRCSCGVFLSIQFFLYVFFYMLCCAVLCA